MDGGDRWQRQILDSEYYKSRRTSPFGFIFGCVCEPIALGTACSDSADEWPLRCLKVVGVNLKYRWNVLQY